MLIEDVTTYRFSKDMLLGETLLIEARRVRTQGCQTLVNLPFRDEGLLDAIAKLVLEPVLAAFERRRWVLAAIPLQKDQLLLKRYALSRLRFLDRFHYDDNVMVMIVMR